MINQHIISDSLQQFQKLRERISSLNEFLKVANKEMELVKKINEIDLVGLEGSLKQYTDTAIGAIPQPDLSNYLNTSNVLVVPSLPSFPWEDENPLKNGNLLVPKRYVDQSIPNLSNYATKTEIPDLSNYLTINGVYVQPQTGPIDLTVVEFVDPEGHKLITKKYLDSTMPDPSSISQ
jgi:hypothetical protein